jgi:hypothetical protein
MRKSLNKVEESSALQNVHKVKELKSVKDKSELNPIVKNANKRGTIKSLGIVYNFFNYLSKKGTSTPNKILI